MIAQRVADADLQIQTLRRHVADECVAIASSIDVIPREMVPREMRDRWLQQLLQVIRAVALVEERLAPDPPVELRQTS
jgi:hypothetical protein